MTDDDSSESVLPYAVLGGAAVCCLGLELLGGVALVGGLAALLGLSRGLTYLALLGSGGILVTLLVVGFWQLRRGQHA